MQIKSLFVILSATVLASPFPQAVDAVAETSENLLVGGGAFGPFGLGGFNPFFGGFANPFFNPFGLGFGGLGGVVV